MDIEHIWLIRCLELIGFVFMFFGVAFFAGGEIALTSLSKWSVKKVIEEKGIKAHLLQVWLDRPNQILATILVGTNLMVIAVSSLAAEFSISIAYTMRWKEEIVLTITTIIISFFVLLFGEIIPKVFSRNHPESVALAVIKPLVLLDKLLSPIIKSLLYVTKFLVHIFAGRTAKENNLLTENEIRSLIDIGEKDGVLEKREKEMIDSILEFTDTMVREVMAPLENVEAVDINNSSSEIIDAIITMKYSRVPVFKGTKDNIIGIIYARDLLYTCKSEPLFVIQDIMSPVSFIEETQKIGELMREFKRGHMHLAMVVDKNKKVLGLVTIEDLIEEIVGDISDEYD